MLVAAPADKTLERGRGKTPAEFRAWRDGIYEAIRRWAQEQGALSVERMCHLAEVSRASDYRRLEAVVPEEAEMAFRAAIQEMALAHRRRYGWAVDRTLAARAAASSLIPARARSTPARIIWEGPRNSPA